MKNKEPLTRSKMLLIIFLFSFDMQEKHLDEALRYTDGHICRDLPSEVGVFHVESSEARKIFQGTVHIMINIAPGDPNIHWIINPALRYFFQKAQERLKCISVELCDYSLVPRKVNAQVRSSYFIRPHLAERCKAVFRLCLFSLFVH